MPWVMTHLQIQQVCKLQQCVRNRDKDQIIKLIENGAPDLINYNEPGEGITALMTATLSNDCDMLQFLVDHGAHPDVADYKGRTASMRAAEYGNTECLEKLLLAGANMTLTDHEGKGILFYCIYNTKRHTACMDLAIAEEADVNNKSKDGTPVFVLACETATENEQLCLTLLKKGADPKSKVEPPLPKPRVGGKLPVKFAKSARYGRTALMAACTSGSATVIKAILSHPDGGSTVVNWLDARKNHAAHFAATGGHLECLMIMGGYNAVFDQINSDCNTAIHLAAMGNHAMCCKYLAQRGCNPKLKNHQGNTARNLAKDEGHKEASKELGKAEKSFGRLGKNDYPWAITFYDWIMQRTQEVLNSFKELDKEGSCQVNRDDLCNMFIEMGAPVDDEQLHKIMGMYERNRENIIDYNEFMGAKKWVNKNYHMSAFEKKKKKKGGKKGGKRAKFRLVMPICMQEDGPRTSEGGPPEVFIPYQIHFTDFNRFSRDIPPIHPLQDDSPWYLQQPEQSYLLMNQAAKVGDFDSLKAALKKGGHVDTRDKYFKTALMTACASGHLAMVKFLVEKGASINLRDNFKWTALHHACHAGQLDVVQFLVENGGEIDAVSICGGTPLTRSIESSRDELVQFLINRGVKVQTENAKGMTPMDIALSWADLRVIETVQNKWETLPHHQPKGKPKKGAQPPKKGKRAAPPKEKEDLLKNPNAKTSFEELRSMRASSIIRKASALAAGQTDHEDIVYVPRKVWIPQPTSQELVQQKVIRRSRFGWEVDFKDFQMPFLKNITTKLAEENQ